MKTLGAALVLACSLVGVACSGTDPADTQDAQDQDLKAKMIVEGSREAYGVLTFVNDPDTVYATLLTNAGLSANAAESIARHVKGSAWQGGKQSAKGPVTPGQPLQTMAQLDALPYVGSVALGKLLAYAKKIGDVPDYYIDEIPLSQADASAIIFVANTSTLLALETDGGLTAKAATHVVAARPIKTVEQLGALSYVDKTAMAALHEYATAVTAPAFGAAGVGTPVQFHQLTVQSLPVSAAITKVALAGNFGDNGNPIGLGRYAIPAGTLTAVLADSDRASHLAGDLLFGTSAAGDWTKDLTADLTLTTANQAFTDFVTAVYGDAVTPKLSQPVKVILDSMLKGLKSPKVYHLHWDNQDDTSVEGIAVLDTATGEMRVVAVFFPA